MGTHRLIWMGLLAGSLALAAAVPAAASAEDPAKHPRANGVNNAEFSVPDELRNVRYCEVLPMVQEGDTITTFVYNTLGWNFCPADLWDQLTEEQVNQEYGSQASNLNGPRYWVIDDLEASGESASDETFIFGGIKMTLRATLSNPADEPAGEQPYVVNEILRETQYTFDRGKLIYELVDPDGQVYVMQSYAQIVNPTLTIGQLRNLGRRLRLPEDWSYRAKRLRHDLQLTASGVAYLVQDNLLNSYQRMTKPTAEIARVPRRCVDRRFKVRVKVDGDTALTRVKVGGTTLKLTTSEDFKVTVPTSAVRSGNERIAAVSRNDAGSSRDRARFRVCSSALTPPACRVASTRTNPTGPGNHGRAGRDHMRC